MMQRLVGGTSPSHVTKCYKGLLDALVIDRADAGAARRRGRRPRGHGYAHDRPRGRPPARPHDAGGCNGGSLVKIALVGGTGSFGMALAVRLRAAGYDVVIGSRDAERAQAAAAELGGEEAGVEGHERGRRPRRRSRRPHDEGRRRRRDGALAARGDRNDAGALRRGRAVVHEGRRACRPPRRRRSPPGSRTSSTGP